MIRVRMALAVAVLTAVGGMARADEVLFKNGDRLTGTILTMEGGKLKIKTGVAGDVTVDMKDVKTFSTDKPVTLKLNDGTVLKQKVSSDAAGAVSVPAGQVLAAQKLPLGEVKKINPQESWAGALTLGGLLTRGNSQTEQLNVALDLSRRTDQDRITLGAGYLFGRETNKTTGDKTTTTDNWFVAGKYDYFLTPRAYVYGAARVEKDRIAFLDLRLTPSVGVGYQFIDRPDFHLSAEGGVAWVYEQYSNDGSDDHIAVRLAYHVDKKLNSTVSVFHNLTVLPSLEELNDYNLIADAGIRAQLTDKMFAELKLQFNYDSTPAPGASRTDLRYLLGVGWTF